MKQKVIIFGGSFNPITTAHLNVAWEAHASLGGECQVWFVPTREHAFFKDLKPFEIRRQWLHKTLDSYENAPFKYDHKGMGPYMVDYLEDIQEKFPFDNFEFYILIGSDLIETLPKWKNYIKLWDYNFIIVQRGLEKIDEELILIPKYRIVKTFISDISSTNVRLRIEKGASIKGLVPACIEKEIKESYRNVNKIIA